MHCRGHVRGAFCEWVESVLYPKWSQDRLRGSEFVTADGERFSIPALLGELHHCTDTFPGELYRDLGLTGMQTYASAVRYIRQERQV